MFIDSARGRKPVNAATPNALKIITESAASTSIGYNNPLRPSILLPHVWLSTMTSFTKIFRLIYDLPHAVVRTARFVTHSLTATTGGNPGNKLAAGSSSVIHETTQWNY